MRIGFDIDGVLADFIPAYMDRMIELTGRNTFERGDRTEPPTWNWDTLRGYTKAETKAVWENIKQDPAFWMSLGADRGVQTLRMMLPELEHSHDVYYITTRLGTRCKRQSEVWLCEHLRYQAPGPLKNVWPTVLIAQYRQKGGIAKGLGLDAYIDDNLDNANDVQTASPETQVYLLNRGYNQAEAGVPHEKVIRVSTVGQMFDHIFASISL